MEIKKCKCGKSQIEYEVVGEDLWNAETTNCTKKRNKEKGVEYYTCNSCGAIVDENDMYMMVNFD